MDTSFYWIGDRHVTLSVRNSALVSTSHGAQYSRNENAILAVKRLFLDLFSAVNKQGLSGNIFPLA